MTKVGLILFMMRINRTIQGLGLASRAGAEMIMASTSAGYSSA